MLENIPFLPSSEGEPEILGRSLNELSHLSKVLSFLVGETNQYKLQLDFLLLVHLALQTAFDPDEKLDTEIQLANRFRNRFKRYIRDDFVSQVIYRMRDAGWIDRTRQDGLRITNSGIRMGSMLLDMVQKNYIYHEKDDLQKEIFIAKMSTMNLETSRKLNIESMPNFLQLINSVHRMTELVQRNIPTYIHKQNALEEVIQLKELLKESVEKINEYSQDETITEKLDDFRLRNVFIQRIQEKAIIVAVDGLGEVIKALTIATSQLWTASISRDKFVSALHEKIRSAVQQEYYEESEIQSAYDIILQMETEHNAPIAFLPAKIFGGISPEDVLQAIGDAENGNYGIDFIPNKRRDILHTDIVASEPEYADMEEVSLIEEDYHPQELDSEYLQVFEGILEVCLLNEGKEETIKDWIQLLPCQDRFNAATFMDLISYTAKLLPSQFDMNETGISKTIKFPTWYFVSLEDAKNVFTGDELIRFPTMQQLERDSILEQLKGLVRRDLSESNDR